MSLKYGPYSEPLHISAQQLFLNWELPESNLVGVVAALVGPELLLVACFVVVRLCHPQRLRLNWAGGGRESERERESEIKRARKREGSRLCP